MLIQLFEEVSSIVNTSILCLKLLHIVVKSLSLIYSHSTFGPRDERELPQLVLKDRLVGL